MTSRTITLAAGALLASLAAAGAQNALTSPPDFANEGNASASASGPGHVPPPSTAGNMTSQVRPAFVPKVGWNNVHATNCVATLGAKQVVTLKMYPSEGGYFSTVLPAFQTLLTTQCGHGNWVSIYINKLLGGGKFTWTQARTWDYK